MSIDLTKLKAGDRRTLAKAITLIESKLERHRQEAQDILNKILPQSGNSIRIGISGVPGVGKSTFIESFGLYLTEEFDKKIAVLAVDPSSPISGGSVMGDKTRMEKLVQSNNAFIRPSPSDGALGGVANKTRETILLCEASGFEIILVETVGVGQSEYEVADMVDCFLVLMLPNAGDEIQGIKRGILELTDLLIINKADVSEASAEAAKNQYKNAFQIMGPKPHWTPKVLTISALHNLGMDKVWKSVNDFISVSKKSGHFEENRRKQKKKWMDRLVVEIVEEKIHNDTNTSSLHQRLEKEVISGKITPYAAAKEIISTLIKE